MIIKKLKLIDNTQLKKLTNKILNYSKINYTMLKHTKR